MDVRLKVLIPLVAVVAIVLMFHDERQALLFELGVALLTTWIALEVFVRRPLAKLAQEVSKLSHGNGRKRRSDELGRLSESMSGVRENVSRMQEELARETRLREQSEAQLRELERKYDLELSEASDGRWEWNLKTGEAFYSARWKSMLGYSEDEIGDDIDEWKSRIHPDDFAEATANFDAHCAGSTAHYQSDHRLRQKDGSYRWMLSRGTTIRHASGKGYRFIGLNTDICEIKRAQQVLVEMAAGISTAHGSEFFQTLVKSFAMTLGVHRAFVTECMDFPASRVRIRAYWVEDEFVPNKEFDLAGTPCEEVIHQGKVCLHRSNFSALYPKEAFLNEESYCGFPIFSSTGTVIGHIALYDQKPMKEDFVVEPVFKIFATRAGTEMERLAAENALAIEKSLTRGLLDTMSEAVITTDANGHVAYMNPVAERMTGVTRADATGIPLAQIFRVLDMRTGTPIHNALLHCLALRVATRSSGNAIMMARNGEKAPVQQWAASFVDSTGAIAGGVLLFNHEDANLEIPLLANLQAV